MASVCMTFWTTSPMISWTPLKTVEKSETGKERWRQSEERTWKDRLKICYRLEERGTMLSTTGKLRLVGKEYILFHALSCLSG